MEEEIMFLLKEMRDYLVVMLGKGLLNDREGDLLARIEETIDGGIVSKYFRMHNWGHKEIVEFDKYISKVILDHSKVVPDMTAVYCWRYCKGEITIAECYKKLCKLIPGLNEEWEKHIEKIVNKDGGKHGL